MVMNRKFDYISEVSIMINTQYDNIGSHIITSQNVNGTAFAKTERIDTEARNTATNLNRDTFEHIKTDAIVTYSPNTIEKVVSEKSTLQTTSQATTDYQREKIPILLATKIAGIGSDSNGMPIVTGKYDYEQLQAAWNTIHGNHTKLNYNQNYCYSQTGASYGNPNPRESCCTFAFATALSIKYGKSITPDKIVTGSGGFVKNHWDSADDRVMEWRWNDGSEVKTAYRISESSGNATLTGIDAQLQLGNPVLIHTSGRSAQTGEESEHWATVIGKENGRYKIIDPWDGTERYLEDMEIYKNGGSILDYTILSDKY